MTEQNSQALASVLAALDGTKDELRAAQAEMTRLRQYGKRNRLYIVVDILLTVLLSCVGGLSVHAVRSAAQANSAQAALCQAGNVSRAQQIELWDHLIDLPPAKGTPPRTPAQAAQLAGFKAYVSHVFMPRDCAAIGEGH